MKIRNLTWIVVFLVVLNSVSVIAPDEIITPPPTETTVPSATPAVETSPTTSTLTPEEIEAIRARQQTIDSSIGSWTDLTQEQRDQALRDSNNYLQEQSAGGFLGPDDRTRAQQIYALQGVNLNLNDAEKLKFNKDGKFENGIGADGKILRFNPTNYKGGKTKIVALKEGGFNFETEKMTLEMKSGGDISTSDGINFKFTTGGIETSINTGNAEGKNTIDKDGIHLSKGASILNGRVTAEENNVIVKITANNLEVNGKATVKGKEKYEIEEKGSLKITKDKIEGKNVKITFPADSRIIKGDDFKINIGSERKINSIIFHGNGLYDADGGKLISFGGTNTLSFKNGKIDDVVAANAEFTFQNRKVKGEFMTNMKEVVLLSKDSSYADDSFNDIKKKVTINPSKTNFKNTHIGIDGSKAGDFYPLGADDSFVLMKNTKNGFEIKTKGFLHLEKGETLKYDGLHGKTQMSLNIDGIDPDKIAIYNPDPNAGEFAKVTKNVLRKDVVVKDDTGMEIGSKIGKDMNIDLVYSKKDNMVTLSLQGDYDSLSKFASQKSVLKGKEGIIDLGDPLIIEAGSKNNLLVVGKDGLYYRNDAGKEIALPSFKNVNDNIIDLQAKLENLENDKANRKDQDLFKEEESILKMELAGNLKIKGGKNFISKAGQLYEDVIKNDRGINEYRYDNAIKELARVYYAQSNNKGGDAANKLQTLRNTLKGKERYMVDQTLAELRAVEADEYQKQIVALVKKGSKNQNQIKDLQNKRDAARNAATDTLYRVSRDEPSLSESADYKRAALYNEFGNYEKSIDLLTGSSLPKNEKTSLLLAQARSIKSSNDFSNGRDGSISMELAMSEYSKLAQKYPNTNEGKLAKSVLTNYEKSRKIELIDAELAREQVIYENSVSGGISEKEAKTALDSAKNMYELYKGAREVYSPFKENTGTATGTFLAKNLILNVYKEGIAKGWSDTEIKNKIKNEYADYVAQIDREAKVETTTGNIINFVARTDAGTIKAAMNEEIQKITASSPTYPPSVAVIKSSNDFAIMSNENFMNKQLEVMQIGKNDLSKLGGRYENRYRSMIASETDAILAKDPNNVKAQSLSSDLANEQYLSIAANIGKEIANPMTWIEMTAMNQFGEGVGVLLAKGEKVGGVVGTASKTAQLGTKITNLGGVPGQIAAGIGVNYLTTSVTKDPVLGEIAANVFFLFSGTKSYTAEEFDGAMQSAALSAVKGKKTKFEDGSEAAILCRSPCVATIVGKDGKIIKTFTRLDDLSNYLSTQSTTKGSEFTSLVNTIKDRIDGCGSICAIGKSADPSKVLSNLNTMKKYVDSGDLTALNNIKITTAKVEEGVFIIQETKLNEQLQIQLKNVNENLKSGEIDKATAHLGIFQKNVKGTSYENSKIIQANIKSAEANIAYLKGDYSKAAELSDEAVTLALSDEGNAANTISILVKTNSKYNEFANQNLVDSSPLKALLNIEKKLKTQIDVSIERVPYGTDMYKAARAEKIRMENTLEYKSVKQEFNHESGTWVVTGIKKTKPGILNGETVEVSAGNPNVHIFSSQPKTAEEISKEIASVPEVKKFGKDDTAFGNVKVTQQDFFDGGISPKDGVEFAENYVRENFNIDMNKFIIRPNKMSDGTISYYSIKSKGKLTEDQLFDLDKAMNDWVQMRKTGYRKTG